MSISEIKVVDQEFHATALRETTAMLNNAATLDLRQQDQYAELRELPSSTVPNWKRPTLDDFE